VRERNHIILISETTEAELLSAPRKVQETLRNLEAENLEVIPYGEEVEYLRDRYIEAGVLSASSINDAAHVAAATVADADIVLSWNFRHIVNVIKVREFNSVNLREGYKLIDIRSPKELIYEEEI